MTFREAIASKKHISIRFLSSLSNHLYECGVKVARLIPGKCVVRQEMMELVCNIIQEGNTVYRIGR